MIERNGEDLVRPACRVIPLLAIDDVVQVSALVVPEARIERLAGAGSALLYLNREGVVAFFPQPPGQQRQRVVPERVDLHRLAAPRRDDPVVHLRIHPGELVAFLPLPDQAVRGIDAEHGA